MHPKTWDTLRLLIGTWEGSGTMEFPTLDPVAYREVLDVRESTTGGFLHYLQQTWRQQDDSEVASHHETGFLGFGEAGALHLLNAQGSERTEILRGTVSDIDGRLSIELASVAIAGDDRVTRTWRSLEVDEDNLAYTMGMATTQVPEGAIHLAARLSRR